MEIWDILDENGNKTGRTITRGEKLEPGDYYLAVHIWIRNSVGEYLIQKRTDDKPLWPGMWAATGGAAVCGETSREAVIRETEEELGVRLSMTDMVLLERIKCTDWFTDLWLVSKDIQLDTIVMQPEEVCAVKWASGSEIKAMVERNEFVKYDYLDSFFEHMQK